MFARTVVVVGLAFASFGVPIPAQAGFVTKVLKGTLSNGVRHGKKTLKDAKDFTKLIGSCTANRAKGRPC